MQSYPYAFHVALDGSRAQRTRGPGRRVHLPLRPGRPVPTPTRSPTSTGWPGGHAPTWTRAGESASWATPVSTCSSTTRPPLEEVDRVSTLRFEVPDTTIKSSTHLVWLDDSQFLTAIGEHFWKFDLNRLTKAEADRPAPAQAPARHEADRVGPLRRLRRHGPPRPAARPARSASSTCVTGEGRGGSPLPTTCWHVVVPPDPRRLLRALVPGAARRRARLAASGAWPTPGVRLRDRRRDAARSSGTGRPVARSRRTSTPTSVSPTASSSSAPAAARRVVLIDLATMAAHRLIDEHPDSPG